MGHWRCWELSGILCNRLAAAYNEIIKAKWEKEISDMVMITCYSVVRGLTTCSTAAKKNNKTGLDTGMSWNPYAPVSQSEIWEMENLLTY